MTRGLTVFVVLTSLFCGYPSAASSRRGAEQGEAVRHVSGTVRVVGGAPKVRVGLTARAAGEGLLPGTATRELRRRRRLLGGRALLGPRNELGGPGVGSRLLEPCSGRGAGLGADSEAHPAAGGEGSRGAPHLP